MFPTYCSSSTTCVLAARCGVKGERGKCGDEVDATSEVGSIRKRLQELVHVCHKMFLDTLAEEAVKFKFKSPTVVLT